MRINILALGPEEQPVPFAGTVDLSDMVRWGEAPFPEPVKVSGTACRKHGQTLVELKAEYAVHATCARCLQPVVQHKAAEFSYVVVEHLEQDSPDNWVEAPGGILDVDALVGEELFLNLDASILCRKDCKGLCPVCGADRNQTDCGCDAKKVVDPRFAALSKLLDDKEDNQ
ncbi:MAG TPA: DUF177 domain-containing protein [Clostridiales bacterium]|nr:DUF177 domain-containing protein [Clostridiales bacterium]